jgi:uncharacterized protein with PIN domain
VKFLADAMLGSLARWLRILGYDTELAADKSDTAILGQAAKERRILLTRDRELYGRALGKKMRAFLITSPYVNDQLGKTISEFSLKLSGFPSRTLCPVCNGRLGEKGRKGMEGKVPKDVYERDRTFWLCSNCGKSYWRGSHWGRIRKKVSELAGKR